MFIPIIFENKLIESIGIKDTAMKYTEIDNMVKTKCKKKEHWKEKFRTKGSGSE